MNGNSSKKKLDEEKEECEKEEKICEGEEKVYEKEGNELGNWKEEWKRKNLITEESDEKKKKMDSSEVEIEDEKFSNEKREESEGEKDSSYYGEVIVIRGTSEEEDYNDYEKKKEISTFNEDSIEDDSDILGGDLSSLLIDDDGEGYTREVTLAGSFDVDGYRYFGDTSSSSGRSSISTDGVLRGLLDNKEYGNVGSSSEDGALRGVLKNYESAEDEDGDEELKEFGKEYDCVIKDREFEKTYHDIQKKKKWWKFLKRLLLWIFLMLFPCCICFMVYRKRRKDK